LRAGEQVFVEEVLDSFRRIHQEGTDGRNSRGEFANHRKPLDLGKVQGRYDDVFPKGSKLRRGGAIDQDHEGRWIHTYIVDRGFVSRSSKLLQQELRYRDPRYPDEPRTVHHLGCVSKDSKEVGVRSIGDSETGYFCSLESRNAISRRESCVGPQEVSGGQVARRIRSFGKVRA
jgi:hypothetical protein